MWLIIGTGFRGILQFLASQWENSELLDLHVGSIIESLSFFARSLNEGVEFVCLLCLGSREKGFLAGDGCKT